MRMEDLEEMQEPLPHPGRTLREDFLKEIDRDEEELAEDLGLSPQHLRDILNENVPVTPKVSIKIAQEFDLSPGFFLRLQNNVDLYRAYQVMQLEEELE